MSLPAKPVTLSVEQIRDLNKKLSSLRHEVNSNLSLIIAAAEILRREPNRPASYWDGLIDKPHRIAEKVSEFSRDVEIMLGLRD